MLDGQLPDPARPDTAVIDQDLAARQHLRPGGTLHLLLIPNTKDGIPDLGRARAMSFRVTGIAVFDSQIVPATKANAEPTVLLSPGFYRSAAARDSTNGSQAGVRLRPGVSVASFAHAAAALARRYPATGGVIVVSLQDEAAATQRAIHPQAVALAVFAALVALIALAVIGQLLSRQLSLDSAEYPVLSALGMSRATLAALSLARLAVVTAAGAVLAVVIAIAASPLMPIGPARLAEPHPGTDVNLAVLGAGLALIAGLPLLLLAAVIWRNAARAAGPPGPADPAGPAEASRLGAALGRLGSVPGSIGVRMAFEPGHGRTAVPVRSALAGTIVAVTSVVAALVFGASLIHLVSTPRLYGQRWQQELDLGFGGVPGPLLSGILARQPGLTSYAIGNYGDITVQGTIVPAIGVAPVRGRDFLSLLAGRPPARRDEIALGAQTLRTLHRRIGQRIAVQVNGVTRPMLVTGTAVFAAFSRGSFESTDLGSGAVLSAPVLSQPEPETGCPRPRTCYSFALLRYRPGTDLRAAAARLITSTTRAGCPPGSCVVVNDQRPDDIRNFSRVRDTPLVLGRRPGPARRGHARPRARHRGAAAAPRPGHAQDPRPGAAPGAERGGMAGAQPGRGGPADRRAARPAGRALGLGAVRLVGRPGPGREHPGRARAAHHPGHRGAGRADRRLAGPGCRTGRARHRAAGGVADGPRHEKRRVPFPLLAEAALAGGARAGAAAWPDRRGSTDRSGWRPPHRHRLPAAAALEQRRQRSGHPRLRRSGRFLCRTRPAAAGRVDVHRGRL